MTLRHSLFGLALALGMLTLALPQTANAQSGASLFRVSIVGIRCVTATSESPLSLGY